MKFELNEDQLKKLKEWKEVVYAKGVELQRRQLSKRKDADIRHYEVCWDMGYPYTGTIGGQFTYEFTPNSIGESVSVVDAITGEKLDLTDFSTW